MKFLEKLKSAWIRKNSMVCIGLDPDGNRIPAHLKDYDYPLFEFNRQIVEATAGIACAYKPQIAYYSAVGAESELAMTIAFIRENHPAIPIILDAKRSDIGSTAKMYAREAFERYGADAVTVNPYMGGDTLEPFLNYADRGTFVLCRTSNPGSGDLQDLQVGGQRLFHLVARHAVDRWNEHGNVGLVVGAPFPDEMAEVRAIAPTLPFLVPGIGAQGAPIEPVVRNGLCAEGFGLIVNSSRGIIYAGTGERFAESSRHAAEELRDKINRYR